MAKDFSTINTSSRVYDAITEATRRTGQQDTAPAEEAEERKAGRKTQGRKGVKLPRINLAVSSLNYDYIKVCSRQAGITQIEFVNRIIDQYREAHAEEYETAKKLQAEFETAKLPTNAEEAETFIVNAVASKNGMEPGSLNLAQAVEILLKEYNDRKAQEGSGEE